MPALLRSRLPHQHRNNRAAIEKIKKQIALYPDHGSRMFALAEAYGRVGQEREAVKWLNRALDTGIDLDLSASNAFPSFQDSKGFQKVFQEAPPAAVPITNAVVAFHPAEKDIIPEGIIFDPGDKQRLYRKHQEAENNPDRS